MLAYLNARHRPSNPIHTPAQILAWGWRVPFLTGSVLGVVGILLRTQTKGLQEEDDENDANPSEEHLPLHAPPPPGGGGGEPEPSSLAVVGEGLSPAVLEADRTRDYRARHRPHQHHATFCSVMRAAAGADTLRVGGWVWNIYAPSVVSLSID